MWLMYVLCALVLAGFVAIWRWGSLEITPPWADQDDPEQLPASEAVKRFVWYATVAIMSGVTAGVVMFGAGGRLVMRLLAITGGSEAQGLVTEAEEIVGDITIGGTLGFIAFTGIFGGTLVGIVYMLIHRWLPRGRWAGITFGGAFFVLAATRIDPLRPDNKDFDLVGPGWLAVISFALIFVGAGMLLAAVAARYAAALPILSTDARAVAMYVPAYVVLGPSALIFAIPLAVGIGGAILLTRVPEFAGVTSSKRSMLLGRALGIALIAVAAPGFVIGVAEIATHPMP